MHPLDPDSPWRSRWPRDPVTGQKVSLYTLPPPELEPEPLDDPANLVPFPANPRPAHPTLSVDDLPW